MPSLQPRSAREFRAWNDQERTVPRVSVERPGLSPLPARDSPDAEKREHVSAMPGAGGQGLRSRRRFYGAGIRGMIGTLSSEEPPRTGHPLTDEMPYRCRSSAASAMPPDGSAKARYNTAASGERSRVVKE